MRDIFNVNKVSVYRPPLSFVPGSWEYFEVGKGGLKKIEITNSVSIHLIYEDGTFEIICNHPFKYDVP